MSLSEKTVDAIRQFAWSLRPEHQKVIAKPFAELANFLLLLPDNAQRADCLDALRISRNLALLSQADEPYPIAYRTPPEPPPRPVWP